MLKRSKINVRLPLSLKREFKKFAKEKKLTMAQLIRKFIAESIGE